MFKVEINGFETQKHAELFWAFFSGMWEQQFDIEDDDESYVTYHSQLNSQNEFSTWNSNTLECSVVKINSSVYD